MKFAVISDIHSNLHALNEVKKAVQEEDVDFVLCAGDIVGYGAFPDECCRIVRHLARATVLGNHELSVLSQDTIWMNPYAARAILWTSARIDDETRGYLGSLSREQRLTQDEKRVAMFHGSPRSISEYIYEDDVNSRLVESASADIIILGHTHIPFVKSIGDKVVLNPGAVGQPRDGDPRASFAVIDLSIGEFMTRRVEYDIEAAAEAIESAGLPSMLADRLFSGL
jgi:putative phosphoesterase